MPNQQQQQQQQQQVTVFTKRVYFNDGTVDYDLITLGNPVYFEHKQTNFMNPANLQKC